MIQTLIPKWLKPVKGRKDQVAICREMTKALGIGSESVDGFPTVFAVRDVIQRKLCSLLIEQSGVKIGDQVTYHKRRIHYARKGANTFGWEDKGKVYTVRSVCDSTLSLNDGQKTISSVVPLYCPELLAKIGVTVDFVQLDAEAKALADATKT